MNVKKIVIDGKTYNSVEDMPEDVRRNYEEAMKNFGTTATISANPLQALNNVFVDANQNGTPDIMENHQQVINISGGMKFVVDGQTYNSVDELPPAAREKYEQAVGALDKNRNGTPDFLEGLINLSNQTAQPLISTTARQHVDTARHASRAPLTGSPAIAPDTSNGWMLALAGLFVLMICALGAIGVWYFFLR